MVIAMRALEKKLIRNLWQIRGQVLAIALVIAAAVAMIVLSSGTYRSLELTRNLYYEQYRFADVFASLKRAPDSTLAEIGQISGVVHASTSIREYALLDMPGVIEPVRGLFISLPEGVNPLNQLVLRSGHWPEADSTEQVLVHEAFAQAHDLHPGDPIHATIYGKQHHFTVAGIALSPEFVYALGPGDLIPDNKRFGIFWMNRDALASAGNLKGAFNEVALKLSPAANPDEVVAGLDRILRRYGGTGAFTREDQRSDSFISSELKELKSMTRIMPPIFLGTAVFLLNIAIGRLVETERGQLGLLKAIGYSDNAIGFHYLQTALVIACVGILIGWPSGLWMGHGMAELYIAYFKFPVLRYHITPGVFLGAATISLAAAGLGALAAIRKAVRLPPAVAMAPPPPPLYQTGLGEKIGLFRGITPSGRMVVRHLVRWPFRSGLTVLGVTLSIALLLSTLNFFDSIDVMLESFFHRNNRQDLTISFTEIRPDSAAADIRHLDGVLKVELQRNVSARLVAGHLSKRTAIQGLDPGAELSQPLDIDGRKIFLPAQGVVLNEWLARYLNIRQGDLMRIEILEGRMPDFRIPVTGVSKEYVGLSAYISRTTLNRYLRDGPVANTAIVTVDASKLESIYRKIREMPFVAGVTALDVSEALFRRLIQQNLFTIVTFYVLFASVLAFGVVYNNARLTLIERSREFSLLRVLGFHQREVAWILGGEVALLTLLALPLGCILGYGLVRLIVTFFASDLYRIPFAIEPSTYGYAVLVILIAAIFSGLLALYRLGELDLLSVLKERE
ncbi:ABC transporter permease [Photobacterium sp. CCB-ST2H9]|uniref:ABC transporter permease n=1 Tax=Photobacterium sp. CCB-ST2H9 TaxID=2912855 RepID=UPI0020C70C75|nr:ABC transporter permease [Photobacterium sp. CCB-ST2H9]UTM59372.1 ABC transporter permease [Photobacterium sp. CCB-ST2H9]